MNNKIVCSDCGKEISAVTPAEQSSQLLNPFGHVAYCGDCTRFRMRWRASKALMESRKAEQVLRNENPSAQA